MDRPSISVMSPTSPGALRDLPLVLPGQLSVSVSVGEHRSCGWILGWIQVDSLCLMSAGETVVRQSGPPVDRQRPSSHRSANTTRRTASEPLRQDVLPARQEVFFWPPGGEIVSVSVFVCRSGEGQEAQFVRFVCLGFDLGLEHNLDPGIFQMFLYHCEILAFNILLYNAGHTAIKSWPIS